MVINVSNSLIVLVGIVTGAIVGELLNIEARLDQVGEYFERKFGGKGNFAKAFITSTLLYCVGPLAILGALQDGLRGDVSLLLTKTGLDGVCSIAFAATFGIGVLFSTIPLFLYQGGITVGASLLEPFISQNVVELITATGGLLVIGIALNILEIAKIKVGNMLPAILITALLAAIV